MTGEPSTDGRRFLPLPFVPDWARHDIRARPHVHANAVPAAGGLLIDPWLVGQLLVKSRRELTREAVRDTSLAHALAVLEAAAVATTDREPDPEWLTVRTAARRAGCSEQKLRRLIRAGLVPAQRVAGARPYTLNPDDLPTIRAVVNAECSQSRRAATVSAP